MSTITKEQLIEDLKTSTQNSSGMFEIGEETICALMSLLTTPPAPVSVPDEREAFNAWNNDTDCPLAGRDAKTAAWLAWCRRAAMLQGADGNSPVIPDGWVLVPKEPTEDMIVNGFESEPDESFSDAEVWEAYDAMSGCQQAAHRAKLCWSAMISAAPKPDVR
ncbi:hypothetical protein [Enterobacter cloacae]|uniref:hypothetical protein n=1 Tax=Enterobacter cloacae TaxID=550 RepID=UPI002A81FC69|nr:hypothetical protein [Enterobacter cloacae]